MSSGERLPAETALAERFKVSLPTIRQAVGVLRAQGVVESKHGIGTFVRQDHRLERRSRCRYSRARSDGKLLTCGTTSWLRGRSKCRPPSPRPWESRKALRSSRAVACCTTRTPIPLRRWGELPPGRHRPRQGFRTEGHELSGQPVRHAM
ncbi:FadR/GntR family transcriptional regulator [Nonomuraea insulae]|uniref:FadR/GntR family transcriptional regulator n=1 Tax=Nonomuraea insulae TaxID=1616787 RepID=A0ABW1D0K4_9ACTN